MDQVFQSLQSLSIDNEDRLSELEDILNYKFKNKSLLKEAITHSSINNTESYERLEFVGDSVLGYLVTKHLYCTYPELYQGTLTLLRSRNVDTEKFARVSVKHKLYRYVFLNAPALQLLIEDFVKDIEDASKSFRCGDFKPPKVLADIVESIAGAVFVDCGYSADQLWEVFRPLLEPLVSPETLELHPVTELQELCQKQGKYIEYKDSWIGNMVRSQVLINGEVVGNGEHNQKELAERVAAKNALDKLKKEDKVDNSSKDEKQSRSHEQPLVAQQKLNNFCMKKHWPSPVYKLVKEEGPSHMKKFVYSVCVCTQNGWTKEYAGSQKSRTNEAKDSAAKEILDFLQDNNCD